MERIEQHANMLGTPSLASPQGMYIRIDIDKPRLQSQVSMAYVATTIDTTGIVVPEGGVMSVTTNQELHPRFVGRIGL